MRWADFFLWMYLFTVLYLRYPIGVYQSVTTLRSCLYVRNNLGPLFPLVLVFLSFHLDWLLTNECTSEVPAFHFFIVLCRAPFLLPSCVLRFYLWILTEPRTRTMTKMARILWMKTARLLSPVSESGTWWWCPVMVPLLLVVCLALLTQSFGCSWTESSRARITEPIPSRTSGWNPRRFLCSGRLGLQNWSFAMHFYARRDRTIPFCAKSWCCRLCEALACRSAISN